MHLSHFIRIYILKRDEAIYKSDVTKYLTIDHDHKVPCHMVHTPVMSSSYWDPNTYNLYSLLWFQLNKNMHTLFHENIYTLVCTGTHSRWIIHINALNLQIWRFTRTEHTYFLGLYRVIQIQFMELWTIWTYYFNSESLSEHNLSWGPILHAKLKTWNLFQFNILKLYPLTHYLKLGTIMWQEYKHTIEPQIVAPPAENN